MTGKPAFLLGNHHLSHYQVLLPWAVCPLSPKNLFYAWCCQLWDSWPEAAEEWAQLYALSMSSYSQSSASTASTASSPLAETAVITLEGEELSICSRLERRGWAILSFIQICNESYYFHTHNLSHLLNIQITSTPVVLKLPNAEAL